MNRALLAFAAGIILAAVTIESGIGYPICVDQFGVLQQGQGR